MSAFRVLLLFLFLALVAVSCRSRSEEPYFQLQESEAGLAFLHTNGARGEFYFPEIVGAGGALFDFDNDGDLDLYVVQGGHLGPSSHPPGCDRLFRNELVLEGEGRARLRFTDVTEASGLRACGYGMGVATGDYDNDGWVDLYVTNFGSNQLWHNEGNGTFRDVTEESGVDVPLWSTSATFFDFDGDGFLDLFVTNYVDYDLSRHKICRAPSGRPDYCGPQSYDPTPDRLFRNRGDGTFQDVSIPAGILSRRGSGLGVVAADFNGDGRMDIYVANDLRPNFLWINQGDGTFSEEALLAGCAVNEEGKAEASMGVVAADFDGDGDEDLFMTHLNGESNTFYRNDGRGWFEDQSSPSGLAAPSLGMTGFGAVALDLENDGWLDLAVVNGAVYQIESQAARGDPFPFRMPNQLFRNLQGRRFVEVSTLGGPGFLHEEVSRGLSWGDLDNDGDTDLVVFNANGPLRLLLNQGKGGGGWVGLRLWDPLLKRDALGALLRLQLSDGRTLWRRCHTDGSYASAGDPRLLVGVGRAAVTALQVLWPDGTLQEVRVPPLGRYWVIGKGEGEPLPYPGFFP